MNANVTIVNEVGVDPGIDHMLAMQCFDEVKHAGGKVGTFLTPFFILAVLISRSLFKDFYILILLKNAFNYISDLNIQQLTLYDVLLLNYCLTNVCLYI